MTQAPSYPVYKRPKDALGATPFDGDLFDRRELADRLTAYVERLPEGCVFAIDAPWGDGKTWFGRNWEAYLRAHGFRTVYVDAFQRDYVEDAFLVISGEILESLKDEEKSPARRKLIEASKSVGKALMPIAAKAVTVAASRLLLGSAEAVEEIKKAVDGLEEGSSKAVEAFVEKRIEDYASEKKSVDAFKSQVAELASSSDKPIVFFIDELDRCKPPFAVQTIERIKHFFDVPGLVFVLLLNRRQLVEAIRGVYGAGIDADAYLGKFIQFSLTLPKQRSYESHERDHNRQFCQKLLRHYGFPDGDASSGFGIALAAFTSLLRLSFRDIERGVVLFSLAQPVSSAAPFIAWPIALKLSHPDVFLGIIENRTESHIEAKELLHQWEAQAQNLLWMLRFFQDLHHAHTVAFAGSISEHSRGLLSSMGTWSVRPESFLPWLFKRIELSVQT